MPRRKLGRPAQLRRTRPGGGTHPRRVLAPSSRACACCRAAGTAGGGTVDGGPAEGGAWVPPAPRRAWWRGRRPPSPRPQ
eukprot:6020775-Pleurochrysis_carterae.AAC.1